MNRLPPPHVGDRARPRGEEDWWQVYRVWRSMGARIAVTVELAKGEDRASVHITEFDREWEVEDD